MAEKETLFYSLCIIWNMGKIVQVVKRESESSFRVKSKEERSKDVDRMG